MIGEKEQQQYWEKTKYRSPEHAVTKAYVLGKIEFIQRYVCLKEKSILDIGCGNGVFSYHLSDISLNVIGLDLSSYMISINPCKNLIRGMGDILPFKDETFDVVFEANLLHHVDNPEQIVREMMRVSKEHVILIEPNGINPLMFLFSLFVKAERGGLKFSKKYLRELIKSDSFRVVKLSTMGMITQNNTPQFLLPLLKPFDREFFLGQYIIAIAQK